MCDEYVVHDLWRRSPNDAQDNSHDAKTYDAQDKHYAGDIV